MRVIVRILLTTILLYGCGVRISIKLPSIDMSWADEFSKSIKLADKASKAFNNVMESCSSPVKDIESGHAVEKEDFNKCTQATTEGFKVYLEIIGKEETKKLLQQVINDLELEAQKNGLRK